MKTIRSEHEILTNGNIFNMVATKEKVKRRLSVLLLLHGLEETDNKSSKRAKTRKEI